MCCGKNYWKIFVNFLNVAQEKWLDIELPDPHTYFSFLHIEAWSINSNTNWNSCIFILGKKGITRTQLFTDFALKMINSSPFISLDLPWDFGWRPPPILLNSMKQKPHEDLSGSARKISEDRLVGYANVFLLYAPKSAVASVLVATVGEPGKKRRERFERRKGDPMWLPSCEMIWSDKNTIELPWAPQESIYCSSSRHNPVVLLLELCPISADDFWSSARESIRFLFCSHILAPLTWLLYLSAWERLLYLLFQLFSNNSI